MAPRRQALEIRLSVGPDRLGLTAVELEGVAVQVGALTFGHGHHLKLARLVDYRRGYLVSAAGEAGDGGDDKSCSERAVRPHAGFSRNGGRIAGENSIPMPSRDSACTPPTAAPAVHRVYTLAAARNRLLW